MDDHLYITADKVGDWTGGGGVTALEYEALKGLGGRCTLIRPDPVPDGRDDPFWQDGNTVDKLRLKFALGEINAPKLAHFYAGCFTRTAAYLKSLGCKVTYTVAAHCVGASRRAHHELGVLFHYPHLNDPELFERYIGGYKHQADVVVTPSTYSAATVRDQGRVGPVRVIPHACKMPDVLKDAPPLGPGLRVGYLGAVGPDKGLVTLARAWAEYQRLPGYGPRDALALAGLHSTHPYLLDLFNSLGCRNVHFAGWQDSVTPFYESLHLYAQPSNTEGFGIEVAEALGHGRPVICSEGAGAKDLLPAHWRFPAGDHLALARKIAEAKAMLGAVAPPGPNVWRVMADPLCRPERVTARYQGLWKEVLA